MPALLGNPNLIVRSKLFVLNHTTNLIGPNGSLVDPARNLEKIFIFDNTFERRKGRLWREWSWERKGMVAKPAYPRRFLHFFGASRANLGFDIRCDKRGALRESDMSLTNATSILSHGYACPAVSTLWGIVHRTHAEDDEYPNRAKHSAPNYPSPRSALS